jgi:hypothetical protein
MQTQKAVSRRGMLAGIPAIAATMGPAAATALGGLPAQAAADPIFAAIEAHKAATFAAAAVFDDDDADDGACRKVVDPLNKALKGLFTTAPTTVAGVTAWLEYITSPEFGDEGDETIVFAISEYNDEYREAVVPQCLAAAAVLKGARS